MIDTLIRELPYAEASGILDTLGLKAGSYVYITLHRPSNVDDPAVLNRLMDVFLEMSKEETLVFAVHPRTRARMVEAGFDMASTDRFKFIEPLGYRDNLMMIRSAKAMLTDSGGIQEEASALNIPCLTLRNNTERPVTVELGSSELVGNDPARIREAWGRFKSGSWKRATPIPLWDGKTGERIVRGLRQAWG
jgi:UDP-N-acetylglucosamine 2-epimerase (non-hydrolysing)